MTPFETRLQNLWRFVTTASISFVTSVIFLAVLFFAGLARAQDGGVLVPGPLPVPDLGDDPIRTISGLAENIARGDLWPAAAAGVTLLTWIFRSGLLRNLPKTGALKFLGTAGTWLYENPIAAFATPMVLSSLLAFITTFANGTPFTWSTAFGNAAKIGGAAIAIFIGIEKVKEAKNAGKLEAAGVTTQQEALDELAKRVVKGPQV